MVRRRMLMSLTTVVSAIAMIASGCSSSGGQTDSGGSASGGEAAAGAGSGGPTRAGTPIKIGVICSCSGPTGATISAVGKTTQAWAKSVNAAGGIDGHQIDLIFKDDTGNPGKSVTEAQNLVSQEVAAVIDLSNLSGAWGKTVTEADIPVIGGLFAAKLYYENPNFYPSGQTNVSASYGDVSTAKAAGATNLGHLYCAESPVCQEGVATHKQAGKKLGVPLVYSAAISATAPNYTAQCLAAKQAGVTALFIGDAPPVIEHVAQDCTRQGYKPIYLVQGGAFTPKMATTAGLRDTLWTTWSVRPAFDTSNPAVRKMTAAVDKYYPGLRSNSDAWSGLAPQGWTAGVLIEKAVQAADASGEITASVLRKGLDSMHGQTLDGLSPPLTFTAGKPHEVNCWFTARVQDGKPVLIDNGKLSCEK